MADLMNGRAPTTKLAWIDVVLSKLRADGKQRETTAVRRHDTTHVEIAGRRVLLFSGNDYLGLSHHPEVRRAAAEAAEKWGLGPRGSALVCGYSPWHEELEQKLAEHEQTETALLFPTGYAANIGVLTAVSSPQTAIFSDELNHASIVDGCRLSGATTHIYHHRDVDHLEQLLTASTATRKVIVTDSVFSMDGNEAPLRDLAELRDRHDTLLVVDEAHATLVYGNNGGGLAEAVGVVEHIDVRVGTLSKAFGALGGFVATSRRFRDLLVNTARSYVYSTALPIPVVAAALKALELATESPNLRDRLWKNAEQMATGLNHETCGPIVPIILGAERAAVKTAETLLDLGFHVVPIRPPTVPPGTSRLRIALSAQHTEADISGLLSALTRSVLSVDPVK